MRKSLLVVVGFASGLGAFPVLAQNLQMTDPPSAEAQAGTPGRGLSMGQVEARFGAPAERYPAVGQPPITRWVYPSFVVFFEYDHVVHTVSRRAPATGS
jgi:hypothetical protein